MKTEKPEKLGGDESDQQAESLTDLSVTDEQADQAKGALVSGTRLLFGNDLGTW